MRWLSVGGAAFPGGLWCQDRSASPATGLQESRLGQVVLVCGDIYKASSLCLRCMACLGQRKRTSRVLSHLYSFYVDQEL